jgi:hypothetical protein
MESQHYSNLHRIPSLYWQKSKNIARPLDVVYFIHVLRLSLMDFAKTVGSLENDASSINGQARSPHSRYADWRVCEGIPGTSATPMIQNLSSIDAGSYSRITLTDSDAHESRFIFEYCPFQIEPGPEFSQNAEIKFIYKRTSEQTMYSPKSIYLGGDDVHPRRRDLHNNPSLPRIFK